MAEIKNILTEQSAGRMLAEAIKKKCRGIGIESCGRGTFIYYGKARKTGHIISVYDHWATAPDWIIKKRDHVRCVVDFIHLKGGRECINLSFNDLDEFVAAIPTLVWALALDKKGGTRAKFRFMGGFYLDRIKQAIKKNKAARAVGGDYLCDVFYAEDCAKVGGPNPIGC